MKPCYFCESPITHPLYSIAERMLDAKYFFLICRCPCCGWVQTDPLPEPAELGRFYPADYEAFHVVPYSPFLPATEPVGRWARLKLFLKREVLRTHYGYAGGRRSPRDGAWALVLDPLRAFFQVPPPYTALRQRLLDIGCGAGRYLAFARNLGWEVVGVERDVQAAQNAAQYSGGDVKAGRFEEMEFEAGSFDAVSLWHVLEHVYDPLDTLKRIRPLLSEEGALIIGVPNMDCLQRRLFGKAWWYWEVPRHFWHFTPKTLTALLERAGYQIFRLYAQPLLQPYNPIQGILYALRDAFPGWKLKVRGHAIPNLDFVGALMLPLGYVLTWLFGASKIVVIALPQRTQTQTGPGALQR